MTIQQINLYQRTSGRAKSAFLDPYLLAAVMACLGLAVVSAWGVYNSHRYRVERQGLQTQANEARAELDKLKTKFPNQQIDTLLQRELQQTQDLYSNLLEMLEVLDDSQSDRTQWFSRYLAALAEQVDGRVWLTGIRIDAETGDIALSGSSFQPERIPFILQNLQAAAAFKGRHFAHLTIRQSQDVPGQVDFNVGSKPKAAAEALR
ncbi:MAG: PilN domain-containing protein [Methylomonas sp.]|nr:PilN domain-containing protein [Methylomonas sp.]